MEGYEFDTKFQDMIASVIIKHYDKISSIRSIVFPEYFTDPLVRKLVSIGLEFNHKYKTPPTKTELISFGDKHMDKELRSVTKRIYKKKVKNIEFVIDKMIQFAQFSAMKEAILDSSELVGSFENRIQIRDRIDEALKVGADVNNIGVSLIEGRQTRYIDRMRYSDTNSKIGLGIPKLDKMLDGGLDRGELGMIMAPPKGFKTGTLVNIAVAAMSQRYKVAVFTLEVSEAKYMMRIESRISGLTRKELITETDKLDKAISRIKSVRGGLVVKGYPMRTASVTTIHNHLDLLRAEKFVPDVVIVDYWDLLKDNSRSNEYRHQLANIGANLRALAQERDVVVWTASQVNRKAVDKKVIRKEDIAEAFEKIAIVDCAIAICQTKEEREIKPSRARMFVAASRENEEMGTAPVTIDYERMRIRPLDYAEGE